MAKYVYIDDEFYERINENSYTRYDWSDHIDIDDLRKIIEGLPTIEIVHCKECKYYDDKTNPFYCVNTNDFWNPDGFCSKGERKEE